MKDQGARNLVHLLVGMIVLLVSFYGYLTWRALNWNPLFFVQNADSERSRVSISGDGVERLDSETEVWQRSSIERGRRLYYSLGCVVCHGVAGQGHVTNPNYVKETMPALSPLAERMFLFDPEDAGTVIEALNSGVPLGEENLAVPRSAAVVAQYESVHKVIVSGSPAGKKDPAGHEPLDMPKWDEVLNESQVNDMIAYLLTLYPWEKTEQ